MKLPYARNRKFFSNQTRQSEIPPTIVSRLLTAVIEAKTREIVVEGASLHFGYDTETIFSVGKCLRLCLHDVQMDNRDSSLELNLKGRVKTNQGR